MENFDPEVRELNQQEVEDTYNLLDRTPPEGMKIVVPKENECFIDIDSMEALSKCHAMLVRLNYSFKAPLKVDVIPSKTPGHYHVTVTLPISISDPERIAIQAVCGSDLDRELLSIRRYIEQVPNPTLFFEEEKEK